MAGCDHVNTGRIHKYDGGRRPLLCAQCYTIIGHWDRTDQGGIVDRERCTLYVPSRQEVDGAPVAQRP